jgi:protein-S-isoprenylcysteine O-methyltransferase Ste14
MSNSPPAYGLWTLALIDSAFFLFFAFSFTKPKTKRDWRSFSAFSAFVVALFAEMYGFPLTIFLLSGWFARRFPGVDFTSHDAGHLWETLLGAKRNPHLSPLHISSNVVIALGFFLLAASWKVLYTAQKSGTLATRGPYARVRHPQYDGFVTIMLGFLLQWPTLVTLVMFPILVYMYVRLAKREEADVRTAFGAEWDRYAAQTPRFVPKVAGAWRSRPQAPARHHA